VNCDLQLFTGESSVNENDTAVVASSKPDPASNETVNLNEDRTIRTFCD
jgi:hypothetical protein